MEKKLDAQRQYMSVCLPVVEFNLEDVGWTKPTCVHLVCNSPVNRQGDYPSCSSFFLQTKEMNNISVKSGHTVEAPP